MQVFNLVNIQNIQQSSVPDTKKTMNQSRPNHTDFRHSNNFLR